MTAPASTRPSNDQRIRAALWFADHGFGIFPVWSADDRGVCRCPKGQDCDNAGKHPLTPNGLKDATRDVDRIRTMLSAGSNPNYGMLCPEGVFAWDVDQDDDGLAKLARLEQQYGALPPTLRTETANGYHVFLRWPDDLPRPLKKMFGYVSRWGSGRQTGYVIGPRSVHRTGKEYTPVAGTVDIATLPQSWAEAVLEGETEAIVVGGSRPEDIQVGGRHDWLRNRARHLRGVIDDPVVLEAAVMAENARLAQPKTLDEVRRAIGEVMQRFGPDPVEETEERAVRKLGEDDELDLLGPPTSGLFPEPPAAVAFEGLLGDLVDDLAPGTDASLVGLLGSLISFCGALVPGSAYFHRLQTTSPFVALVGESGVGRKGTAMTRVHDAMSEALTAVTVNRVVLDGLNSGEGLVTQLNYKQEHFKYEPTVGLVFEEEYASLLASRSRDGSTLDPRMRAAFDGGPLANRKANETKTVIPPYWLPALIGITPTELRHRLEPSALQSGSANRWLYLPVVRRDRIPTNAAPVFERQHRDDLMAAHKRAMEAKRPLTVAPGVVETLAEYADFLPTVSYGLARDLTRRMAIIAFRVALVHATVEQSDTVGRDHLERAMALTEYARRGVSWVFGDTIGNPDADLLFRHLQALGRLRVRTIHRAIVRDPIRRQAAIDELVRLGRAQVVNLRTGGRPRAELAYIPLNDQTFEAFGQGLNNAPPENAETVAKRPKEREAVGQKPDISLPEGGQKLPDVGPPSTNTGIRSDGSVWCHYWVEHANEHRDVSASPWCLICSPRGTDGPAA